MFILEFFGGEPFTSINLSIVLNKLIESSKVQRIEVVTNGTIIPYSQDLIKILQNKKIIVSISQYPTVDSDSLIKFLKHNTIAYRVDKMNFWMNYGNTEKRNKSTQKLKNQFRKCNHICKSLLNGQLHLCPRSSHGTDLGIIKNNEADYIDLLDENKTIEEKKSLINKLLKKKYIKACDYCDFATNKSKKIFVAEQIDDTKITTRV